jgi:hypothetical protein
MGSTRAHKAVDREGTRWDHTQDKISMRVLENGLVGEVDEPEDTRGEAVYEGFSQYGDSKSCLVEAGERCDCLDLL